MSTQTPAVESLVIRPMSAEGRLGFLAGPHVAVVSIPRHDRGPLSAPVWYSLDTAAAELWWITPRDSRKGRALRPGLPLTFTVVGGPFQTSYVSVEGPVLALDTPSTEQHQIPLAVRYLGEELGRNYGTAAGRENETLWLVRVGLQHWLSGEIPALAADPSQGTP